MLKAMRLLHLATSTVRVSRDQSGEERSAEFSGALGGTSASALVAAGKCHRRTLLFPIFVMARFGSTLEMVGEVDFEISTPHCFTHIL